MSSAWPAWEAALRARGADEVVGARVLFGVTCELDDAPCWSGEVAGCGRGVVSPGVEEEAEGFASIGPSFFGRQLALKHATFIIKRHTSHGADEVQERLHEPLRERGLIVRGEVLWTDVLRCSLMDGDPRIPLSLHLVVDHIPSDKRHARVTSAFGEDL